MEESYGIYTTFYTLNGPNHNLSSPLDTEYMEMSTYDWLSTENIDPSPDITTKLRERLLRAIMSIGAKKCQNWVNTTHTAIIGIFKLLTDLWQYEKYFSKIRWTNKFGYTTVYCWKCVKSAHELQQLPYIQFIIYVMPSMTSTIHKKLFFCGRLRNTLFEMESHFLVSKTSQFFYGSWINFLTPKYVGFA